MDLKEIRSLVDLMKKNGISVFKLEREDFKITLKTNEAGQQIVHPALPATVAPVAAAQPLAQQESKVPVAPPAASIEIKSPMVGTFYASPSPEADAFVAVGQEINADSVVCIIEAMKVMNEIKAEVSGTIAEICVENGKPVQFGQVLFRVR